MELKYLETVLAVAEFQSFSRAAEEIPCSQASVSRHIATVERELGYAIFERTTRSGTVSLTREGSAVLPKIRTIVRECGELFAQADRSGGSTYRLGLFAGPFGIIARSRIVSQTYINDPDLHLVIEDVRKADALRALTQAKIDGIFMYESYLKADEPSINLSYRHGAVSFEFLKTQELELAVPKGHRFAGRESISFSELRDETFLLDYDITKQEVRREDTPHIGFLKNCEAEGFTPRVVTLNCSLMEFANLRDTVIKERGLVYPTFKLPALHDNSDVVLIPVTDAIYCARYLFLSTDSRSAKNSETICRVLKELCN